MTVPFAVKGIDHVVLRAHDVDRLIAFYVNLLGCPIERISGDLVQLRAGTSLLDIVPRQVGSEKGGNMDHLCLTLAPFDEDQITAWLQANDVMVGEKAVRYGAGGYARSIYLKDSEGNGLELREAVT